MENGKWFLRMLLIFINVQLFGFGIMLNNDILGLDDDVIAMVSSYNN